MLFNTFFLVFLTALVYLFTDRSHHVAAIECHNSSDCTNSQYCCKLSNRWENDVCLRSCAGKACYVDNDCGGPAGQCCDTVIDKCSSRTNCSKQCYSNSDCSTGEYCCKGYYFNPSVCGSSCVGKFCDVDSDCGAPDECCSSSECTRSSCGFVIPGWLIAVFVIVGLLVLVGLVIVFYCLCKLASRRKSLEGSLITY